MEKRGGGVWLGGVSQLIGSFKGWRSSGKRTLTNPQRRSVRRFRGTWTITHPTNSSLTQKSEQPEEFS